MFNIIVDGEIVETVMIDDPKYLDEYIQENYRFYGVRATYRKVQD